MKRMYMRLLVTASAVIAVDQTTKSLALAELQDDPKDLIEGVLTLRLTYNSGGAFGFLQGLPMLFGVATLVAVVGILIWVRKAEETRWMIPLGLVLGGGLGNVTDRVIRDTGGRVVDFIDLHVWPVFNVADVCIVIGVGLVLLMSARSDRDEEPE
jgi:signal peptidase II